MAHKGIVFVNYNYRTGAFGWMSHPELSAEFEKVTGHNSSGNWGMLDQFAAVKWIKENIAAFGGDPDHITVMGQSAGSAATYHILNSPLTKGDIVGAIIESGVRDPHDPLCATLAEGYVSLEESLEQGVEFLASLNVSTIEQARQLPYTELVTTLQALGSSSMWSWSAVLDHYAMPAKYIDTLRHGAAKTRFRSLPATPKTGAERLMASTSLLLLIWRTSTPRTTAPGSNASWSSTQPMILSQHPALRTLSSQTAPRWELGSGPSSGRMPRPSRCTITSGSFTSTLSKILA
jgi:hypothetical protein